MLNNPNRASLFNSFDALNGFQELIGEQEKEKQMPKILLDDMINTIDLNLRKIKKGDKVEVVFYQENDYHKLTGLVNKLLLTEKELIINNIKIPWVAIISLKKLEK